MAVITLNKTNPLILRNSDGSVNSMFYEWRIDALGLLVGDTVQTALYDIESIFDLGNNHLKSNPIIAYGHIRCDTGAHIRQINDENNVPLPLTGLGIVTAAYDQTVSDNRAMSARIISRFVQYKVTCAVDITPGNRVMRFGFVFD